MSPLLTAGMLLGVAMAQQGSGAAPSQPSTSGQAPASQGISTKSTTANKTSTGMARKSSVGSGAAVTLKTDTDKQSYAMGMNLGLNLHHQGVTVNPALVARGLSDAQSGGKTLMTEQDARTALGQLQARAQENLAAKSKEQSAKNRKAGEAFLAENKSKPGVVALPNGLQYKIVKDGTGPKPTASDTVSCDYKGTSINGKEFDSSARHGGPASFPVSGVIKGWTEALQLMPVGSTWQLFIPADLAYGDHGAGSDIEPGETLIFEVTLKSIEQKKDEPK